MVSQHKIKLFQVDIRFLGHNIYQNTTTPIYRAIEFVDKFPNEIKDKKQLQRFLRCLNYVVDFIPNLRIILKPLFKRLKKNLLAWTDEHTQIIIKVKALVKTLPCLSIPDPKAFIIIETDASDAGFGGILKQRLGSKETLVDFI